MRMSTEATIEKLNTKIDDMPSIVRVPRFFELVEFAECPELDECEVNYLAGRLNDVCPSCREDLDYTEMCAGEKFRSLH